MGNCTSHLSSQPAFIPLPTPVTLTKENVIFLYYPIDGNRKILLEDIYATLDNCLIEQIKKIHLATDEGHLVRDIVYVQGYYIQNLRQQLTMILEVVNCKVVIQMGVSENLDLIINNKRKFIVSQVKPPFKVSMRSIFQRMVDLPGLASTKEIMNSINLLNKF